MGWTAEAPDRPAARPATAGSRWQALVDQAERVRRSDDGADLGDFVDDLDRRAAEQHAPVADGVTLATLHAAKGLEWDAVFLCGAAGRHAPDHLRRARPAAVEEERRLLYVGMTRARARPRRSPGRWPATPAAARTRKPSRFLDGAAARRPRSSRPASGGRPQAQGRALPRVRQAAVAPAAERKVGRCADCPASYDEELFERLREWRKERAGEDEVPAYVVFTDATLQLIAEAQARARPSALLRDQRHRPGQARAVRRRRARPGRLSPAG